MKEEGKKGDMEEKEEGRGGDRKPRKGGMEENGRIGLGEEGVEERKEGDERNRPRKGVKESSKGRKEK